MTRVALAYNQMRADVWPDGPPDRLAEYDNVETVEAVIDALRAGGHEVIPLEADETIEENLRAARPDAVFNLAEGLREENRESRVPAICERLGIPYTGSGPLTLDLCLDKSRAKEVLIRHDIPTPRYQVFRSPEEGLDAGLRFPLIVKLLHEGSSMGLSDDSVVADEAALRRQVKHLLHAYGEPALVEEFIVGREFTVGVLGNDPPRVLPIIEIIFDQPWGIVLISPAGSALAFFPQADQTPRHHSVCPAEVDAALARRIEQTAVRAFQALGCRDWCRMEMRLGSDGTLHVLELNPIAGIGPTYWISRAARVAGQSYEAFMNEILGYALERQSL